MAIVVGCACTLGVLAVGVAVLFAWAAIREGSLSTTDVTARLDGYLEEGEKISAEAQTLPTGQLENDLSTIARLRDRLEAAEEALATTANVHGDKVDRVTDWMRALNAVWPSVHAAEGRVLLSSDSWLQVPDATARARRIIEDLEIYTAYDDIRIALQERLPAEEASFHNAQAQRADREPIRAFVNATSCDTVSVADLYATWAKLRSAHRKSPSPEDANLIKQLDSCRQRLAEAYVQGLPPGNLTFANTLQHELRAQGFEVEVEIDSSRRSATVTVDDPRYTARRFAFEMTRDGEKHPGSVLYAAASAGLHRLNIAGKGDNQSYDTFHLAQRIAYERRSDAGLDWTFSFDDQHDQRGADQEVAHRLRPDA